MERTSVTQFCDLPPELRHEIWTLTLPGPRLVTAFCFTKTPHTLHINRESRSVALKHYELVQAQHLQPGHPPEPKHRCVKGYIDFEVDIIYTRTLKTCQEIDKKICHLQENLWDRLPKSRLLFMTEHAVIKFPRLRSYKIVLHTRPLDLSSKPLPEGYFQGRCDAIAAKISGRIEGLKASKALETPSWEFPVYSFAQCQRDAAGLICASPMGCDGILGWDPYNDQAPQPLDSDLRYSRKSIRIHHIVTLLRDSSTHHTYFPR